MDLTDRERQVISSKRLLTDREKEHRSKSGILRCGLRLRPRSKHTRRTQMRIGATAHTVRKGKRRLVSTTSLRWSIHTAMEMVWVLPARHVGQNIPGSMHSSAKVLQKQRNMPRNALRLVPWARVGIALPHNAISSRRSKKSNQEQRITRQRMHAAKGEPIAYALREQEELKAAEPKTPSRTKGSCSVSKDEAARERERFASRPVRRSQGS